MKKFFTTDFFCLALLLAVACLNVFLRPYFTDIIRGDTRSYIEGAQLLQGAQIETNDHNLTRILKPLPLWGMMLLSHSFGFDLYEAFFVEAIVFYLALAALCYYWLKLFFTRQPRGYWLAGTLLFICSYPLMRSGISLLVESGAIFFYLAAVYAIYRFYQSGGLKYFFLSIVLVITGFMWKEYSALAGVLLFLAIVFHHRFNNRRKIALLAAYAVVALSLFLPWQIYVYYKFHYTFVDWYHTDYSVPFRWQMVYYNIKSLFGVFLLGWFLAAAGLKEWRKLSGEQSFLLKSLAAVSLMIFLWKATDSRLFFVVSLPLIPLAVSGLAYCRHRWGYSFAAAVYLLVVAFNYFWLGMSAKFGVILNFL